jgi:GNAT superfamily N-acetyltransferase
VLAATLDDVVMGYAAARRESLRDGAVMAVISDIYVEEGCRGIGLGEALMDEIVAWARREGCIGIDSIALPGNRETKNFFETFGLVARAIIVHRPLHGDA